ncbi:MAG: HDIG domain-containing metalloprotein [Vulcanococcus sp.]
MTRPGPGHRARRLIRRLWRQLQRLEQPRQALVPWRRRDSVAVLLACVLVALVSSWPWLVEPSLRPGVAAPFTLRAPKAATVVDSEELEQRRTQLGPRSHVQVVDPRINHELEQRLERQLLSLTRLADAPKDQVAPLQLTPAERRWLSELPAAERSAWTAELRQAQRRMLQQGVVGSVARQQLERAASLQLESLMEPGRSLGSRLLAGNLQGRSNLRIDAALTQRLIEDLLTQQGIPTIHVSRGQLITSQGEPISAQAYAVLDYFGLVNRRPLVGAWLLHASEALLGAAVMVMVIRRSRASLEPRQALLALGLLLIVQGCKLWFGSAVSPLALLVPPTLLLAQGLGTGAGLAWLAAGSLLWPLPLAPFNDQRIFVAALVAAATAVLAGRQRSRAQLLQLTLLVPLGALAAEWLLLQLALARGEGDGLLPISADLPAEALLLGGLLLAVLLLSPLVESFFDLLTRSRLLELADLERPLLRRLSCEAPGTFEHTLMICGLAEEGARTIHADVDLIRTGALYHDVGKLHGPHWFIENQESSDNPHDRLDDPQLSAGILQAHVDEGLRLARRYRLPRPLADFIPEHQGTLKMGYFLHEARRRDPNVLESAFRYRGPNPRSRETAVLMLADGCEAALRSLPPDTSEEQARTMVRRIIDARWQDGQLADSGLSLAELELLVRAFVRVWRRMRHRRIPYPIPARKGYSA